MMVVVQGLKINKDDKHQGISFVEPQNHMTCHTGWFFTLTSTRPTCIAPNGWIDGIQVGGGIEPFPSFSNNLVHTSKQVNAQEELADAPEITKRFIKSKLSRDFLPQWRINQRIRWYLIYPVEILLVIYINWLYVKVTPSARGLAEDLIISSIHPH